jgi:hypothetical protein
MKSLSQSEYGELRSLYQQVYVSTDEITVDDLSEEVVEEIFDELVQEYVSEGYEIEEVLDVVEDAALDFIEAKVTYGHDTEAPAAPEKKSMLKGRIRYAKRKAGEAVKRAGEKAQGAKAMAGIAGSIAKDEVRRAGRAGKQAVVGAAQKKKEQVKKGVKGLIGRGLRKAAGAVGKVASKASTAAARLGEEAIQEADSIAAMRERAAKRRKQRYGASDTSRGGRDDFRPYTKADYERGEENDPRKKVKEELELDQMIESLVERGHTEKEAYALVAQFTLDKALRQEDVEFVDEAQQLDEISDKKVQKVVNARNRRLNRSMDSGAPNKEFHQASKSNRLAARRNERTGSNVKVDSNLAKEEFVDESQEARNNPEKYEREQSKKYEPVRGEKTPMPPRGDKRREDFEKWYAAQRR